MGSSSLLGSVVTDGSLLLAIGVAALAGLVSFLSPCVLPLVPGYLSYVTGLTGAVMQMVAHGLTAATLFLIVGLLYQRTHSRDLADYGCLLGRAPRFAFFTAFALLAAIGLPGSAGFIAELHALVGAFGRWGGWILLVCIGMLVGAAYGLRVIGRLCLRGLPAQEIDDTIKQAISQDMFRKSYADVFKGDEHWRNLSTPEGDTFLSSCGWGMGGVYLAPLSITD